MSLSRWRWIFIVVAFLLACGVVGLLIFEGSTGQDPHLKVREDFAQKIRQTEKKSDPTHNTSSSENLNSLNEKREDVKTPEESKEALQSISTLPSRDLDDDDESPWPLWK